MTTAISLQDIIFLIPVGVGIAAIGGYLFGSFKKGSSQASATSNNILRGLIDDQAKEITSLRETMTHQAEQIRSLEEKVKNGEELKGLVVLALKDYFENHPAKAVNLVNKIK